VNGDLIDEVLGKIIEEMNIMVPIARIQEG
jgi:hypothetical protein